MASFFFKAFVRRTFALAKSDSTPNVILIKIGGPSPSLSLSLPPSSSKRKRPKRLPSPSRRILWMTTHRLPTTWTSKWLVGPAQPWGRDGRQAGRKAAHLPAFEEGDCLGARKDLPSLRILTPKGPEGLLGLDWLLSLFFLLGSLCIFCGERDESFTEEGLDLHYWKHCPMLTRCDFCKQVSFPPTCPPPGAAGGPSLEVSRGDSAALSLVQPPTPPAADHPRQMAARPLPENLQGRRSTSSRNSRRGSPSAPSFFCRVHFAKQRHQTYLQSALGQLLT